MAKISDPLLLGLDFMLKANAIVNLKSNVLTVPGCEVPINIIKSGHSKVNALAYVTSNVKLAPGQDRNISISSTEYDSVKSLMLFTPDRKWNCLCLPLCLVATDKHTRYVNVRNMSDNSIFLHKGVVLGTLEDVEVCDHAPTKQASAIC